jgi:hypothetical protein
MLGGNCCGLVCDAMDLCTGEAIWKCIGTLTGCALHCRGSGQHDVVATSTYEQQHANTMDKLDAPGCKDLK